MKTYILINGKYPVQYPDCEIRSYVPKHVIMGHGSVIREGVLLSDKLQSIGKHVYIGDRTEIMSCSTIGPFSSISHDVKIGLINHPSNTISTHSQFYSKAKGWVEEDYCCNNLPVKIEADALISANALIMEGVTIGTGAIIGAGSFVNKDVPPYAIVVGAPAKVINYRFNEKTREKLLASRWWELDDKVIERNKEFFNSPSKFLKNLEH